MEIHSVGAELFHADGRTDGRTGRQAGRQASRQKDMMNLIFAFCNFANAPVKDLFPYCLSIFSVQVIRDRSVDSELKRTYNESILDQQEFQSRNLPETTEKKTVMTVVVSGPYLALRLSQTLANEQ
jgi:hypothetical protein